MSAQEIIEQIKELPPIEREQVNKFVVEATQKPASNDSAFLLVKDLCGSLSGPSDLATRLDRKKAFKMLGAISPVDLPSRK